MIKRILVPLDGSEMAERVLPHVEDLSRRLPAEVWFVQMIELYTAAVAVDPTGAMMGSTEMLDAELDAEAKSADRYLADLATNWQEKGIVAHYQILRGEVAETIVDYARSNAIDLIAMSTHGRSGLDRLIIGSVAEQVVLEAGIPVIVVRPAERATGEDREARDESVRRKGVVAER